MAKRKKKKRIPPPRRKRVPQLSEAERAFRFFRAVVSGDQMPELDEETVTDEEQDQIDALHGRLSRFYDGDDPALLSDLKALVAQHPGLCYPRNWLITAYRLQKDYGRALELAEKLLAEQPGYFFARPGVAQILYETGDYKRAAGVLWANGYTPSAAFPEREVFHDSEVFIWLMVSGKILVEIGEWAAARTCMRLLEQSDPGSHAAKEIAHLLQEAQIRELAAIQGITLSDSDGEKT